jgi:hypothetical protein
MAKEMVKTEEQTKGKKLNRRETLKKAGLYAATATGMIALLAAPKTSAAETQSPIAPPGGGGW